MKVLKSWVLVLFFFLVACSGITAPRTKTPMLNSVSLKLTWSHGIAFLGFYAAQEQGFYANEGLDLKIEPNSDSSQLVSFPERVAAGEFEFSMGGNELLIGSQAQGVPIVAMSTILRLSPNSFFARRDSDIVTPADFKGYSIGVVSKQAEHYLEQLLTTGGLTLDDVIVVSVGYDMSPFYEGEVDVWNGYINNEVIRARQQGLDLVTFPLYEYGIEGSAVTLFTSQEQLASNPDLSIAFLRASLRGWQWAVEHPEQAVDIMLEMFPEMADEREFHLASFNAYIPLVQIPGIQIGSIDCEKWLSDERLASLDSKEDLCTTAIFEQAMTENE